MRFFSLQRMRVVLRCRGRPSLATIRLRPFLLHATPPRVGVRQKVWSMRFFASCQSCAARAAGTTIHTGWHGSFAAVSLCTRRSATRFRQPGTTGPDLLRFRSGSAPGIFAPFAVFLACGSRRLFPPFIPTCRLPIIQHRCFLRLLAAVSELLPSESGEIRPTAKRSTSASGSSTASKPNLTHQAMRQVNPALGFVVFFQAFGCVRKPSVEPWVPFIMLITLERATEPHVAEIVHGLIRH